MSIFLKTIFLILFSYNVLASNYSDVFVNNNFNITSLMNAVSQDDEKATEVFLKSGENVNEKNLASVTPLHITAKNNSVRSMKVLLKYNADVNAVDDEGWTPLMRACLGKNIESVELLIKNKANIWLKNNFGETAFLHCVMSNCIECLNIIKSNFKNNYYNKNTLKEEIDKSLNIVYKREDKNMENLLNSFFEDLNNDKGKNKELKKEYDEQIKKEIEYITKKIYIFQGEVRYVGK